MPPVLSVPFLLLPSITHRSQCVKYSRWAAQDGVKALHRAHREPEKRETIPSPSQSHSILRSDTDGVLDLLGNPLL